MSTCGNYKYYQDPTSKYGKGTCTYHNRDYYPEEEACGHFSTKGRGCNMSTCGNCKYYQDPTSKYGKGTCTYYNRDYYPEEEACGHFSDRNSSGVCYLTTACCEYHNLPDDCRELTVMRRFRDSYLKEQPYGVALIESYYADAPAIVEFINKQADKADIYNGIFLQIKSIVNLVETGENDKALVLYMYMVHELYRKAYQLEKL